MTAKSKKVRCLVCNEILTYDNDDTSVLVDHLNLEHSGLDVFRFLAHCQVSSPRINKRGPSRENCSMEAGDIPSDCGLKTKTYKTTVETWTPGPNPVVCPKCGKEGQPIIKKQKNKMARSPLGALCMLGCWPFCFLPFLFRKDQFLDLYCCSSTAMGVPPPLYDNEAGAITDRTIPEPCACVQTPVPSYVSASYPPKADAINSKEMAGLLPSYSTIMKSEPRSQRRVESYNPPSAPPTYNNVPGVNVIPSPRQIERLYAFPSVAEPFWRSHSQPARCPRCDIIVLTITRTHESLATHVAALALCLFGCWPCCLLPYCLNACKNTHHLCPVCKGYLGAYTPW